LVFFDQVWYESNRGVMPETVEFTFDLPVYPERVFRAWLDSGEHSRITGLPARIESKPGGSFSSLDGLVSGEMQVITPVNRILQTWSVPGISPAGQGRIELDFSPTCTGCDVKLIHRGILDGQSRQALAWWERTYVLPLRRYFDEWVGEYPADEGDG